MHHPQRKQEDRNFRPPHLGRGPGPDKVSNDRELARRVSHGSQEPLTLGEPLAVDLDIQDYNRDSEYPPQDYEGNMLWGDEGGGFDDQEPGDPRGKKVIHSDRVHELRFHRVEVEDAFERVENGEEDEDEQGE